ncbi:hypothetical protein JKP88DRAFT_252324 [Tribonema minus]|uniref:EH domain-containing protein n=1 Tax=Tribonema minus TaxID=303371 RepID=A0A835ZAX6_9STRA|nr:hypothetical protein JKP88DRAFT_252324 [Tribonema minus]
MQTTKAQLLALFNPSHSSRASSKAALSHPLRQCPDPRLTFKLETDHARAAAHKAQACGARESGRGAAGGRTERCCQWFSGVSARRQRARRYPLRGAQQGDRAVLRGGADGAAVLSAAMLRVRIRIRLVVLPQLEAAALYLTTLRSSCARAQDHTRQMMLWRMSKENLRGQSPQAPMATGGHSQRVCQTLDLIPLATHNAHAWRALLTRQDRKSMVVRRDDSSDGGALSADPEVVAQMRAQEAALWAMTDQHRKVYAEAFRRLDDLETGAVAPAKVVPIFNKAGFSQKQRAKVWELADLDRDGEFNLTEFSIAYHLVRCVMFEGLQLPDTLPEAFAPLAAAARRA